MNRETVKREIRQNWRALIMGITEPAASRSNREISYICPFCGHGAHGDGLTFDPHSKDGNTLHCFGCNFSGDIIDLYMKCNNQDYNTTLSLLADKLGLTLDPYKPQEATGARRSGFNGNSNANTAQAQKIQQRTTESPQKATPDFEDYYVECRERLNAPAAVVYLNGRGISIETAQECGIGFDPAADPAGAGHPAPRIIIPTSKSYYVGRAIDPNIEKRFAKMNPKGSHADIFNKEVLYVHDVQEVFVCEGAFDALSVIEAGAAAIALNSVTQVDMLLKELEQKRTEATLILCLDNDGRGREAQEPLKEGLRRLDISYTVADICGGYKDPNEHLQANREGFIAAVQAAREQNAPRPDNVRDYIFRQFNYEIEAFKCDVKTGFSNLDEKCGGLYAGLYVLAATSSLGKTTFVHQIGDQIAAAGTDVLYFSLEQSRLEMVSKSLARITAQSNPRTAVTSLAIRKGETNAISKLTMQEAEHYINLVGNRMNIIEGNFNCNISFIGDYIRRYIRRNGTKPVIIIDYLQILMPEADSRGRQQTTKETVDSTVTALKRLSREMGLIIISVSSVNRTNYLTPVNFESLKESGNIEYTADVIWGMQLNCLNDDDFNKETSIIKKRDTVDNAKAEEPRSIDLICLKNRFGVSRYICSFKYYTANDLFIPIIDERTNDIYCATPRNAGRRI